MAAPTLAGYTLPSPYADGGYQEKVEYRGATVEMADGTQQTDLVQASAKRKWRVEFRIITSAQKSTVESAWDAIKDASATFTDPNGSSYSVTRDGDADLEWKWVKAASGFRYSATIALREV